MERRKFIKSLAFLPALIPSLLKDKKPEPISGMIITSKGMYIGGNIEAGRKILKKMEVN